MNLATLAGIVAFVVANRGIVAVVLTLVALLILLALVVLLPSAGHRIGPALLLLVGALVAGFVAAKEAP